MKKILSFVHDNFTAVFLGAIFVVALLNPVFKKFDYGAGFPLVLGFGVLLVLMAWHEWRESRERVRWEKVFLLLFLGLTALSFVFSQTKNVGFSEVLAIFGVVTMYLLLAHQKIKWGEKFLQVVAACGVLAVLWGYVAYLMFPETRMFGPFMNIFYHANEWPNAFALFLLMAWPIYVVLFKKHWDWKESFLLGFVLSALFLTFSRGAMVAFLGQSVLLTIYFAKRIRLRHVAIVILTMSVAVGMFSGANNIKSQQYQILNVEEKLNFSNSESLTSKTERVDFWLGAIELMRQKPLLGFGPFSFRQAYNPIQRTLLGNSDHPHNLFLKIGAENGIPALLAFLSFLINVFITVARRFKGLSKVKQDTVAVLSIAVLGGLAHNLIDYNFNFLANLMLLWMILAIIRSMVVGSVSKKRKSWIGLVLAILVVGFSLFEGGMLVLDSYGFYPRNYYLDNADAAISDERYEDAVLILNEQLELNTLDSRAYYLRGVAYCKLAAQDLCEKDLKIAVDLNPLNDFEYYRAYYSEVGGDRIFEIMPLVQRYFDYVDRNVHFTAYTPNVEAVAEIVDMVLPYSPRSKRADLEEKKQNMLNKAAQLRAEKAF